MDLELRACPFCGNEFPVLSYSRAIDIFTFSCPNCHLDAHFGYASASVEIGYEKARSRAIERWNRRRQPDGEDQIMWS